MYGAEAISTAVFWGYAPAVWWIAVLLVGAVAAAFAREAWRSWARLRTASARDFDRKLETYDLARYLFAVLCAVEILVLVIWTRSAPVNALILSALALAFLGGLSYVLSLGAEIRRGAGRARK